MAKKKKSYIEQMLAWKYRMIPGYTDEEDEPVPPTPPVPPVPPGPDPEEGGDIDPENPEIVDFGGGTTVEPVDPEQPNVRVLAVGANCTVENNTLNLGGSTEGNTLTL